MSSGVRTSGGTPALPRSGRAAQQATMAWEALRCCELCAHRCRVNRWEGERGPCHAGVGARVFHMQTEMADEAVLRPVFAVTFSGCDLRCDFCITGRASWDPRVGTEMTAPDGSAKELESIAGAARRALASGARSVMILGGEPTVHLPSALELAARLPDDATLVWKTNAHGTAEARELLQGVFDVWVADFKFGNDACAERLARVRRYTEIVRENLLWAHRQARLIVRHLLMPGHLECCWRPVAAWLSAELPAVEVSLREGYWPAWFAGRHAALNQPLPRGEYLRARDLGRALGLNLIP
ncbi:MAG: radical SAM protein [Verrucomicrobia bacterium]|nr:radical SAM protein [Verrucomicrobiota bacterium]